jgi:hypothetical protein
VVGSGTVTDTDPGELVDFIDRKLLGGVMRMFSRVDGVSIHPAVGGLDGLDRKGRRARLREVPGVWVGRPRWYSRKVTVHVRPPGPPGREDAVPDKIAAAGVAAPEARMSFGQCIYKFPRATSATDIVQFSLAAMRAVGAQPADGRWEWGRTVELDTSGPAGS